MSAISRRALALGMTAGAVLAWPRLLRAQSGGPIKRIGILMPTTDSDPEAEALGAEFRRGLSDLGWRLGNNLAIDYRWGGGDPHLISEYAQQLVALQPNAILAGGAPAVVPLKRATSTIPIVFVSVSDPVAQGFVQSLAHPGGNLTGFTNVDPATGGRWLDLLHELAPGVKRVGVVYNPRTAPYNDQFVNSLSAMAQGYGVTVVPTHVSDVDGMERAVAALGRSSGGGILVPSDAFTYSHAGELTAAAARAKVPAVYAFRVFVESGGLAAYGVDLTAEMRQAAAYVDRIMGGDNPADLPVQVPGKFELLVNLKAAQGLGLTVPQSLLSRADEVIQ